jgi:hypothetical protein
LRLLAKIYTAGCLFNDVPWIPAFQTVSQLTKLQLLLYRHSGLDPESSAVSGPYVSGCRIKSGMTGRNKVLF